MKEAAVKTAESDGDKPAAAGPPPVIRKELRGLKPELIQKILANYEDNVAVPESAYFTLIIVYSVVIAVGVIVSRPRHRRFGAGPNPLELDHRAAEPAAEDPAG